MPKVTCRSGWDCCVAGVSPEDLRCDRPASPSLQRGVQHLTFSWRGCRSAFWGDRGACTNPRTSGSCRGAVACGLLSARAFTAPVLTASCLWDQNSLSASARGRGTVAVHRSQCCTMRARPLAPALPRRAQHGAGWKRGRSPAWGQRCRLVRQPRSEAGINAARAPGSIPEVPELSIFSEF